MILMAKTKNPAAVALGRLGAKARLTKLTAEQRADVARKAAAARWKNKAALKPEGPAETGRKEEG
jgi:hypothetical protein